MDYENLDSAWDEAQQKNLDLGDGLAVGKIVRFQVADGYAVYEITEIGDEVSYVKYREDLCPDRYTSAAVSDGRIFTDTLESHMKMFDWTLKNFN